MAKVVVIGIAGESGLWQVDLEAGTVVALAEPLKGDIATAATLSAQGLTVTKGVRLAIAATSAAQVAAGLHVS